MLKKSFVTIQIIALILVVFSGISSAQSNEIMEFSLNPLENVNFSNNINSVLKATDNTSEINNNLEFSFSVIGKDEDTNKTKAKIKGILRIAGNNISFDTIALLDSIIVNDNIVYVGPASIEWDNNWINLGIHYSKKHHKALVTCVMTNKDDGTLYRQYFGEAVEDMSIANKKIMETSKKTIIEDNTKLESNLMKNSVVNPVYYGIEHKYANSYKVCTVTFYKQPYTVNDELDTFVKSNSNSSGVKSYYDETYEYYAPGQETEEEVVSVSTIESYTYIDFKSENIGANVFSHLPNNKVKTLTIPIYTPWGGSTLTFTYYKVTSTIESLDGTGFNEYVAWHGNGYNMNKETDFCSTTTSGYAKAKNGHGGKAEMNHNTTDPENDFPGQGEAGAYFKYDVKIKLNNDDYNDYIISEYFTSPTAKVNFDIVYGN
ncbi:hypothetical protein IMX26_07645 [Clostridium sp. 'deep sea']|uniref:hypothetical protein n=1 Tax=Clostridium sp. 'deep sea' TaxID=2779445 RepID=UPI0018968101|nr:hypothetical protein [Clostridium sp. 'deep sea']QOR36669.1 hypothetical protein IMX26_07645 [Clostridium sp. 'deep sea']